MIAEEEVGKHAQAWYADISARSGRPDTDVATEASYLSVENRLLTAGMDDQSRP